LNIWHDSEFGRLISIDSIEDRGQAFDIEATDQERDALTRRFGVLSIGSLAARGTLTRGANPSNFRLDARLEAEVAQQCVISLETVVQRIEVDFSREYSTDACFDASGVDDGVHEVLLDLDSDDLPDPVIEGKIDVGEAVAEQLALELDPFPRASEARFDELVLSYQDIDGKAASTNPFAALASVKEKLQKGE
jgi:uncharacterized metal-binding protein YceD (DUF177 family)